jgi:lipopolysaccharide transport protein LptA
MNIISKSIILFLICSGPLFAQPQVVFEGNKKPTKKQVTTTIKSKTIQIHRLSKQIIFLDDVEVEREDTTFLSDKMIVYYNENKKSKNDQPGSIKRIDAEKNVRIFREEFVATGDHGSYDPQAGTFAIEKNVIFNNGTSIAKGEKFTYNTKTQKGYLTGAPKTAGDIEGKIIDQKDNRVIVIIDDEAENKNKPDQKSKNKNNE